MKISILIRKFLPYFSTALTVMGALVGAVSLSPENRLHHHGSGGNNFALQRYAMGKGRPPPPLMGPGPGTGGGGGGPGGGGSGASPPRLMSRADNPMSATPLNNQTLDRYRRLIPYMTFYIPSPNGDFSLPINQAYNYMPIVSSVSDWNGWAALQNSPYDRYWKLICGDA